jgi:predicted nuclease of predicted toxin-antitoxin system
LKLLFDENLSPRLVVLLADVYHDSVHVHQCGLGGADDSAIWEYAKKHGFSIVSKDSDFQERTILVGSPPKVVWLRTNNCASEDVANVLRAAAPDVQRFIDNDAETCLILS